VSGATPTLRWWKKTIYAAITVALAFFLLEVGARLVIAPLDLGLHERQAEIIRVAGLPSLNEAMEFDSHLFWRLKKNLDNLRITGKIFDDELDFVVSTRDGLRSPAIAARKTKPRVLALGDSCTFGVGVDNDETWPALLQEMLRENGLDVEVINAGVPGYTAFQGLRFLKERGIELRPDLVVVCFGFNDANSWGSRSDLQIARRLTFSRWEDILLESRLYCGLRQMLVSTGGESRESGQEGEAPRLAPLEFAETLAEIDRVCIENGFERLFVIWPYRDQILNHDPRFIHYQEITANVSSERHVRVVSLVDVFLKAEGNLFADVVHANETGCALAAGAILRASRWVE